MSNPEKKLEPAAVCALESMFPAPKEIFFGGYRGLDECFDTALFVLDTNVLLMPFALGNSSVEEIKKVFEKLISSNRLFIPDRVAREFAKNRTAKLSDIYASVQGKKTGKTKPEFNYPILADLTERKAIDAALVALKEQETIYFDAIDKLLDRIKSWEWSDPVSKMYSSLFTDKVFCSHSYSDDQLVKQLEHRFKIKQPPGYKDASKDDGGIGDLAIWLSILELGKSQSRHVIFVSEEGKPDWWQKAGGSEFLLRFELVDEFRRSSNGMTIHVVKLSKLLELSNAAPVAISEARNVEKRHAKFESVRQAILARAELEARRFKSLSRADQKTEIRQWFHSRYENPVENCPYESKEGGYQFIWGGPYDAREEIESEYGEKVSQRLIDEVVSELNDICFEWSGIPESNPDDFEDEYVS